MTEPWSLIERGTSKARNIPISVLIVTEHIRPKMSVQRDRAKHLPLRTHSSLLKAPHPTQARAYNLTGVVAGDLGGARGRAAGQDRAGLADVHDGGARDGGRAVGEGDAVEVGEGHEAQAGLEVLNDPLGVVLAELVGLGREAVGDRLAGGGVLQSDGAGLLGGGIDAHDDGVALGDGEAGEGVGVVGVPLVPGI